jgi:hypothetical protein
LVIPKSPELAHFLRLTTEERQQALEQLAVSLAPPAPPVEVFTARPYRRRPRPGQEFRKLSADERARLLGRESEECGPGVLLVRLRAVIEAKNNGDPRSLAGTLEDLAAAALSWSERTVTDMMHPPKAT